jgi:putative ABC transport system permease protein
MFIAPETAARLGFRPYDLEPRTEFLIRLDRSVTERDVEFAASLLGDSPSTFAEAALPRANPTDMGLIVAVLSVVLALTITAIAVALGESESRADQRALLAIGADPALRRRIVAARAGVIAAVAALLAVPAGLLPVWGVLAGRDQPVVIPLPELLAILVLLPFAAIAGALLLSRPIPGWSAFRDASSG